MTFARRRAAARYGLAAVMAALALRAAPARAGGAPELMLGAKPELILPLMRTLALVSAARGTPSQVNVMEPGHRPIFTLLPDQLWIPNGYNVKLIKYIAPDRRSAELFIDSDRILAYELLSRPRHGWMASFAYDLGTRGPLAGSDEYLSIELKHRF